MPNIKLTLEYNGAGFSGWQIQPGQRTLQGELHRVLEMVLRERISTVHASGRTDAGVHARGQVVSFEVEQTPDLYRLTHAVSSILKNEVAITAAEIVSKDFHPRLSARKKEYQYTILNRAAPPTLERGKVWHISAPLNFTLLSNDCTALIGTHDFSSFRGADCEARSPVKTIFESEIVMAPPFLTYRVVGTGFLKQMVRIVVGTLVERARGRMKLSIPELLEVKDRRLAGVTAPPYGLCLEKVWFHDTQYIDP